MVIEFKNYSENYYLVILVISEIYPATTVKFSALLQ